MEADLQGQIHTTLPEPMISQDSWIFLNIKQLRNTQIWTVLIMPLPTGNIHDNHS